MPEQDQASQKLVLCPYCGHAQFGGDRCQACSGLFEPLSRRATQLAMGPWQIRDKHNPFRPGCCYEVIKKMAAAGKVKPTTVMRGPTTRQFWSVARNVPGVAHLIGYCHACGHHVDPGDTRCGECGIAFTEPRERNTLGLVFKDDAEAQRGQEALDAEIRGETPAPRDVPGPTKRTPPRPAKMDDLLAEVLDLSGDVGPTTPSANTAPSPAANAGAPATAPANRAPTPAAGPAQAPAGVAKPLDFTPPTQSQPAQHAPASAFDVDPTRDLPEGRGISTLGIILIAANILGLATIIVLFQMLQ